LTVARSKPPAQGAAPIDYIESPAAPLQVSSASFDVVLCQQGLQFFPDRRQALREMRRALRPGGRLGVAVWGALDECDIYAAYFQALRSAGLNDLAETMTLPFSWPRGADLAAAIENAEFSDVRANARRLPLVYEGGVEQVIAALAGAPIGPAIA